MNFVGEIDREPNRDEAEEALALLRRWAEHADPTEVARLDPAIARLLPGREVGNYPDLSRNYPDDFEPNASYLATMPDLQNGPSSLIVGAQAPIQHVGISNFRLPIRFHTRDGGDVTLETSVTGTVSLIGEKKGINMSRIMRSFYAHAEQTFSLRGARGGARRLQEGPRQRRCAPDDAVFVSRPGRLAALRPRAAGSITTSRWN